MIPVFSLSGVRQLKTEGTKTYPPWQWEDILYTWVIYRCLIIKPLQKPVQENKVF